MGLPCSTAQAEEEEEEEEAAADHESRAEAVGVPPSTANRAGAAGEEAADLLPLEPAEVEAGVEPRCLEAPVGAVEEEAGDHQSHEPPAPEEEEEHRG